MARIDRLRPLLLLMATACLWGGAAVGEDEGGASESRRIRNPYFEKTEWKVWRDDDSPVENVRSMAREGKKEKVVAVTLCAPPARERLYPLDPPAKPGGGPYVVFEASQQPSSKYAGIWDDVYSSWSGLHGYMRPHWKGPDGSLARVRGHVIDFVDVTKREMMRAGVNFVHQSTTGMAHAITNGVMEERTLSFEKLYFADVLVTAPAHASLTDHSAELSSDLYLAHVPTLFNSVGSSNSETMAITKMIVVGGYLPPATKLLLKRNGLYPSALLAVWKAALPYDVPYDHELRHRLAYKAVGDRAAYPEKYGAAGIDRGDMSLAYHCYDDAAHMRNMVDIARAMDVAPPEAVFSVIRVEGGEAVYRLRKSALVIQEEGQDVVLRVSSEGTYDLQDLPVALHWKLLYGNKHTTVERDADDPHTWTLRVPWGDALPGGRTAVALFANNGRFDGNPAIVSVYRKREDLPGPGLGPADYKFAGTHANRRPVLLGVQDVYVKRGRTLEVPLRAVDPEGQPIVFHKRAGQIGEFDGNVFTWTCPRKEPKGARVVTLIASDETSGASYAGETLTVHVEKPALLAQIDIGSLLGPAPFEVQVSAKPSITPRGKVKYAWDFYEPKHKRKPPALDEQVQGREAVHTFEKPGRYEIALTVSNGKERDTETIGVLVTDGPQPVREPALAIQGNGVYVRPGDDSPNPFDHTDFGTVAAGQERVHRFLVVNTGGGRLVLDRKAPVRITGPAAKAFKVLTKPRRRVDGGGTTRFEVRFRPAEAGEHPAVVEVQSDAGDVAFHVRGIGAAR